MQVEHLDHLHRGDQGHNVGGQSTIGSWTARHTRVGTIGALVGGRACGRVEMTERREGGRREEIIQRERGEGEKILREGEYFKGVGAGGPRR